MPANLRDLDSFGEVAAEDDAILLNYFLSTDTVQRVEEGGAFLVIGRKGAGKTAIVRYFTEGNERDRSRALNLRNYPWNVHASRIDRGADAVDAYVASWRYLIAVQIAAWALENSQATFNDNQRPLREFLEANYGGPRPKLSDIIRPAKLRVRGFNVAPQVLGNALGSVDLERGEGDHNLGMELEALTQALLQSAVAVMRECRLGAFYLHFDELDAGLEEVNETRKQMLIGLILAIRGMRREMVALEAEAKPVLYLRTDLWDDLTFSDKNKITQGQSVLIEWTPDQLKDLVNVRLRSKLGDDVAWGNIIDEDLMRGSQPKWNHIVARTLRRPRDVIHFLNVALRVAKRRDDAELIFSNRDIVESRTDYSAYLKRELDDEILPHWRRWEEALQTLSAIATETFSAEGFGEEYPRKKSAGNPCDAGEALRLLHRFSVIGYLKRSGYGGSSWAFMYEEPDRGWDAHATQFKVHPGLKEHAGLREERR
ncbi:hypothetical protein LR948_17570 [Roseivivax sp. GX 12232]|uniref:P-loop ATPase, Sll1717 family n=1 Tax=Roseivivax sp. GX 12232 TaxID=2900547 RepID=UPI001E50187C|nr:hypothetical protein [Roseivivax sp. GX 12232]MCE0507182.1 hypothetical protein [Roseivivax sp. GX 12232]